MMFFLITMMIPFMCIVLPQMIMMKGIDSLNNYRAMLLPYLYPSAFYIFLFKGFFDQLPQDLLDAARIDGASQFYTFTRICMPLSKSITALLVLNVLVSAWNDFYWYLRAANRTTLWTINLALYNISNNPDEQNKCHDGDCLSDHSAGDFADNCLSAADQRIGDFRWHQGLEITDFLLTI